MTSRSSAVTKLSDQHIVVQRILRASSLYALSLFMFLLALSTPTTAVNGAAETASVLSALSANSKYTTFAALLRTHASKIGIANLGLKTLFAPTNEALSAVDLTGATTASLVKFLSYHILPEQYLPEASLTALVDAVNGNTDNTSGVTLTTVEGDSVNLFTTNGSLYVNNDLIIDPDLVNDNATAVHGIVGVLGVTLAVAVNGTKEVENVVSALTAAGGFTVLLRLLSEYGSQISVGNGAPRTIFAPTDQAFEDVFLAGIKSSLAIKVVEYHIATVYLPASLLLATTGAVAPDTAYVATGQGSAIGLALATNGSIFVNRAIVTTLNILADNVTAVHGISAVLSPTGATVPLNPPPPPGTSAGSSLRLLWKLPGSRGCLLSNVFGIVLLILLTYS
eukprot:TRINITY_DN23135_c0_g1_i1.p1 TRINITY_DN23135_c0_g1~~TRINITY_DN23135_c0_g1_i1.p1  ORF type:complete len:394 (+),score=39.46 TRINITY_DN23135_c0_g1_i1:648-1829(+)